MLAVLLGASAAHAAAPCIEPPAEAGFPPVTLQQVAQGLRDPVHVAVVPDGSDRLYVVEQVGVVSVVERCQVRPEPFLDIRGQVESGGEKGLHTRISLWRRASAERADPKSETLLLHIGQPYSNHNGGQLAFGHDENRELYLVDHRVGKILKIMPKP